MPAPRAGSRKAQVYDEYHSNGADAAMKLGVGLGLAKGTIKSWSSSWAKAPDDDAPPRSDRVMPKGKVVDKGPGKNWGDKWKHSKGVRLWWVDGMGHAIAPQDVNLGDRFVWANQRYVVVKHEAMTRIKKI